MPNLEFKSQSPKPEEFKALLLSVGWGEPEQYDLSELQTSLDGMTKIYTVYNNAELVATARILSDNSSTTQIIDVIVKTNYQRQGIGKKLVKEIMQDYAHTAIYTDALIKNKDFFESCGLHNKNEKLIVFSKAPE